MNTKTAALFAACLCAVTLHASEAGKDWGVEKQSWIDPATNVRIWEMTANKGEANTLYFHSPDFSRDNRYLYFTSSRSGSNQIYRMPMPEGRIVQFTGTSGVGALVPDYADPRRIYYQRGTEIVALDVESFAERKVGNVPGGGGLTLSGNGKWLAMKRHIDSNNSEIGLVSTDTGEYRMVARTGFHIGHVQHSPTQPVIFFAWETNDYAPRRSWLVNTDGTGLRPFYYRLERKDWFTQLKEVVTHEAWIMGAGDMTMVNHHVGIMVVKTGGTSRLICPGRYCIFTRGPMASTLSPTILKAGSGSSRRPPEVCAFSPPACATRRTCTCTPVSIGPAGTSSSM
jgi:hypothetical protein